MRIKAHYKELPDVAAQIDDHEGELAVRFCEGPRSFLNWQAGILLDRHLNYRGIGMQFPINETVKFFRLLGYGNTREAAIENARNNRHRKIIRL